MKHLAITCGPPYSGKTYFGSTQMSHKHYELDKILENLAIKEKDKSSR